MNNLFGLKMRCGHCGGRMMQSGYQSRYLVCYEASRGNACDHKGAFKYRPFEDQALASILPMALDERYFRQAKRSSHLGLEIASTEKAIRDKQAEAKRLVALLQRVDSPTTEAALVDAEREIATLKSSLATLSGALAEAQGAATAETHLERVFAVKDALRHPQDDVRLPARLRVAEALGEVLARVDCTTWPSGEKAFYVTFQNLKATRFEDDGTVTDISPVPLTLKIAA